MKMDETYDEEIYKDDHNRANILYPTIPYDTIMADRQGLPVHSTGKVSQIVRNPQNIYMHR